MDANGKDDYSPLLKWLNFILEQRPVLDWTRFIIVCLSIFQPIEPIDGLLDSVGYLLQSWGVVFALINILTLLDSEDLIGHLLFKLLVAFAHVVYECGLVAAKTKLHDLLEPKHIFQGSPGTLIGSWGQNEMQVLSLVILDYSTKMKLWLWHRGLLRRMWWQDQVLQIHTCTWLSRLAQVSIIVIGKHSRDTVGKHVSVVAAVRACKRVFFLT